MRLLRTIFLIILTVTVCTSCGSSKKASRKKTTTTKRTTKRSTTPRTTTKPDREITPVVPDLPTSKSGVEIYIETYAEIAKEEMELYGIPASITLAQGILESGAGKGELVGKARNHFGIKCHKEWKGQKVYHDDDERGECFRKYSLDKFSYRDHSLFLSNRSRYLSLFKLPKDDYKSWAKGLKKAGYATDPKYPNKLIGLIKKYELYRYDGEVLGKSEDEYEKVLDKADQHTVESGETLYRIAKKYDLTVDQLKEINGLESNEIFVGQILFVKSLKRDY